MCPITTGRAVTENHPWVTSSSHTLTLSWEDMPVTEAAWSTVPGSGSPRKPVHHLMRSL